MAVRLPAQQCEIAPHYNSAVSLHREGLHKAVGAWIEGVVCCPVRIKAAYVCSRLPTQSREASAHQDFAVRLHGQGKHDRFRGIISACPRAECRVNCSRCIEPADVSARLPAQPGEIPAHQNFPIWLDHEGIDGAISFRIERAVHGSIRVEPTDVGPGLPAQCGKVAPHQDFPVGLHVQAIHRRKITTTHPGIERRVQRPVGIEPPNVGARLATQRAKRATDQNFAVGLHGQRPDCGFRISVGSWIENGIETSIWVKPAKFVPYLSTQCCERPAHQNSVVCLYRQRIHGWRKRKTTSDRPRIEGGIQQRRINR